MSDALSVTTAASSAPSRTAPRWHRRSWTPPARWSPSTGLRGVTMSQIADHVDTLHQLAARPGAPTGRLRAVIAKYALIQHEHRHHELATLLHHGEHVAHARQLLTHKGHTSCTSRVSRAHLGDTRLAFQVAWRDGVDACDVGWRWLPLPAGVGGGR